MPDQRAQVRWPCTAALDVYPVAEDGTIGARQEGKARDVSFGGIAFEVGHRLTAKIAYLNFKTFADLAPLAMRVRVVRTEGITGGMFKVGAAFGTAGMEGATGTLQS